MTDWQLRRAGSLSPPPSAYAQGRARHRGPRATGRGDRAALAQLSLPLHSATDLGSGGRSKKYCGCFSITRLSTVSS